MQKLTNALHRGNLTARERFLTLIKNDIHRTKTGKDILTEADKDALENWQATDNNEAREWNTLNEGWMLSGKMDLEIELIYKDAQVAYLSQLPFTLELLSYPADQRMEGAIKTLKSIKKVTVAEATEIARKQREVKLKEGMDFDYAVYQLAFELLSPEDKKRMKELYEEVEYEHQWLDQEEVIANLLDGKDELASEAKKRLATLVAEKSYNRYAKEYQLFHYFACIPILQIAKYFLKSKNVTVDIKKDNDGLLESDAIKKAMQEYATEHGTSIKEILKKACLAALDSGLLDDYTPLVISDDTELFQRWLEKKKEAREILKKHIDVGELAIRKRAEYETTREKFYSKGQFDGELELAKEVLENIGLEAEFKTEADQRVVFETFHDSVITGESLYSLNKDYGFVRDFKKRVDKYDANLGLVYADDDPEQTGHHLDQEFLICDTNDKGEAQVFSRYGVSITMLSNIFEAKMFFKEKKADGKIYLEFKNPLYEALFMTRQKDVVTSYTHLLAFEEIFKKLDAIYEADMSHHVSGRIKDIREFIVSNNQAIRVATNTHEDEVERKGKNLFRRKEKLHFKEELLIDTDSIQPDRSLVEKHAERLKGIFRGF